jgi:hypothetical protein
LGFKLVLSPADLGHRQELIEEQPVGSRGAQIFCSDLYQMQADISFNLPERIPCVRPGSA